MQQGEAELAQAGRQSWPRQEGRAGPGRKAELVQAGG